MAQCPHMLTTTPSMCLPTPATGGQHEGPNMPQAHGAHEDPQDLRHSLQDLSQKSKISKMPWGGNQHMHVVMWLHVVVANDFGCIHWSDAIFCIFLMNLINLSSAAMATEFAISRPMDQRPALDCFWVSFWGRITGPSCML